MRLKTPREIDRDIRRSGEHDVIAYLVALCAVVAFVALLLVGVT